MEPQDEVIDEIAGDTTEEYTRSTNLGPNTLGESVNAKSITVTIPHEKLQKYNM